MPGPRKPEPAVLEGDYRIPAALGSVAWAIALVVLLIMGDTLRPQDEWWIGVCLTGLALGLFALAYIPRWQRAQGTATESPEAITAATSAAEGDTELDTAPDTDAAPPADPATTSTDTPTAESDPETKHSQRAE